MKYVVSIIFLLMISHTCIEKSYANDKYPLYFVAQVPFLPKAALFLVDDKKNIRNIDGIFIYESSSSPTSGSTYLVKSATLYHSPSAATDVQFRVLLYGNLEKGELFSSPLQSVSDQSTYTNAEQLQTALVTTRERLQIREQIISERERILARLQADIEIINNTSKIRAAREQRAAIEKKLHTLKVLEKATLESLTNIPSISPAQRNRWEAALTQVLLKTADAAKRAERRK
jgi:hypothetical protein